MFTIRRNDGVASAFKDNWGCKMENERKKGKLFLIPATVAAPTIGIFIVLAGMIFFSGCTVGKKEGLKLYTSKAVVSDNSKTCLECHTKKQPSLVD